MPAARPTILILTTHTGGGHLNLAQALQEILDIHYNVVIANPQSLLVDHWYAAVSRHFVKFLSWQFVCTDNAVASSGLQRAMTLFSRGRISRLIEDVQPQLMITTHAFLSYAAARARERTQKRIPLVFQLTDLGRLHMTWFTEKCADAYLAPTREIFSQALQQGIDKSRLHLTGRPVRSQFLESHVGSRRELLTTLGLDPAIFTIFLQGGAKGSAGIDRTIKSLLRTEIPVQILLATGNNRHMTTRYTDEEHIRTIPFTATIAPYMAAADVIAGKAGASFISEACMLEKPFLVTSFIPGQETANLQFIAQHNLGWVALDDRTRQGVLAGIVRHPEMLATRIASIQAYKSWNQRANAHIRPVIDRLLS